MNMLVTGGLGFIGRHVAAAALGRGHIVHVLSRGSATERPAGSHTAGRIVTHDLRQADGLADKLRGIDCVVHCAGLLDGTAVEMEAAIVDGTRNLLNAMAQADVHHIIGLSTFAIYDYEALPPWSVLDERAPLETNFERRHPYVRAKREQELLLNEASERHAWRCAILRPGLVYGPGRTWFHHLGMRFGPRIYLGLAGESPLPLVFVEHLAAAVVSAAEANSLTGATINIVDDTTPTRAEYLAALATHQTPRPRGVNLPWPPVDLASRVAASVNRAVFSDRLPLPDLLRPASLHERAKPLHYPNALAKERLGWRSRFSMPEALARCFNSTPS